MFILVLLLVWIASVVLAVSSFPRALEVRRRLHPLMFMIVPWSLAILSGPFVIDHHAVGMEIRSWMMTGQYSAMTLLFVVAAFGIFWARGARRCASAISVANIIPVFLLISVSVMIIDPGS